jgi:hypothetical protein
MTERGHVLKQQPEGVRGALVTRLVVGAIVVGAIAVLVSSALLAAWKKSIGSVSTPAYPVASTVAGIHQTNVRAPPDGLRQNQAASRALGEYRYVDREHQIAQIPIEQAMEWLADDTRRGAFASPDPATVADAGAARPVER